MASSNEVTFNCSCIGKMSKYAFSIWNFKFPRKGMKSLLNPYACNFIYARDVT